MAELLLTTVYVVLIVINVMFFIKIWNMTNHVQSINNKLVKSNYDFKTEFNKYVLCGDFEYAKDELMDEISSTKEFQEILKGTNEIYKNELVKKIETKYKVELNAIDLKLDWDRIINY